MSYYSIFDSLKLIPEKEMESREKLSCILRLSVVLCIIMIFVDLKYCSILLIFSLLIIYILYYNKMSLDYYVKENWEGPKARVGTCTQPQIGGNTIYSDCLQLDMSRPANFRFCDDTKPVLPNNPEYISMNQRLVGGANPKTKIAPVVTQPIYNYQYWKANNLMVPSVINDSTNEDVYLSGFFPSNCCDDVSGKKIISSQKPKIYKYKELCKDYRISPEYTGDTQENFTKMSPMEMRESRTRMDNPMLEHLKSKNPRDNLNKKVREDYTFEGDFKDFNADGYGDVNTACGYNPRQLFESNIPVNEIVGTCQKDPVFKNYNKNLYTQIIEPGIYTTSQVNEPINSNIGISYTQQLLPKSCSNVEGGLLYTEMDPRILEPYVFVPEEEPRVTEANVYDPRYNGYGTSYRAYNNKVTGQTRFMYDDVDAIRMPNYITRNAIDATSFGDTYGPIPDGNEYGNEFTSKIRSLANDAFLNNAIGFRTSMKESLMRKRNNEMAQLRKAPVTGLTQYTAGSRRIF